MSALQARRRNLVLVAIVATTSVTGLAGAQADPIAAEGASPGVDASSSQKGRSAASVEENRCVACHRLKKTLEEFPPWARDHFTLWYVGVHGRANVTCDDCHGGDARSVDRAAAHAEILSSRDARSPTHYTNLPKTCGSCHAQARDNFVRSDHYKALVQDRLAPSCTTCHGFRMEIGPATASLIERCTPCHGGSDAAASPEVVERARMALEDEARARAAIEKARVAIELARGRGEDPAQAAALIGRAEELLGRSGGWWHSFHLTPFETELIAIRGMAQRAQTLALEPAPEP